MVVRLTLDQKVACSIHIGFVHLFSFLKNMFYSCQAENIAACFTRHAEFEFEPLIVMIVIKSWDP